MPPSPSSLLRVLMKRRGESVSKLPTFAGKRLLRRLMEGKAGVLRERSRLLRPRAGEGSPEMRRSILGKIAAMRMRGAARQKGFDEAAAIKTPAQNPVQTRMLPTVKRVRSRDEKKVRFETPKERAGKALIAEAIRRKKMGVPMNKRSMFVFLRSHAKELEQKFGTVDKAKRKLKNHRGLPSKEEMSFGRRPDDLEKLDAEMESASRSRLEKSKKPLRRKKMEGVLWTLPAKERVELGEQVAEKARRNDLYDPDTGTTENKRRLGAALDPEGKLNPPIDLDPSTNPLATQRNEYGDRDDLRMWSTEKQDQAAVATGATIPAGFSQFNHPKSGELMPDLMGLNILRDRLRMNKALIKGVNGKGDPDPRDDGPLPIFPERAPGETPEHQILMGRGLARNLEDRLGPSLQNPVRTANMSDAEYAKLRDDQFKAQKVAGEFMKQAGDLAIFNGPDGMRFWEDMANSEGKGLAPEMMKSYQNRVLGQFRTNADDGRNFSQWFHKDLSKDDPSWEKEAEVMRNLGGPNGPGKQTRRLINSIRQVSEERPDGMYGNLPLDPTRTLAASIGNKQLAMLLARAGVGPNDPSFVERTPLEKIKETMAKWNDRRNAVVAHGMWKNPSGVMGNHRPSPSAPPGGGVIDVDSGPPGAIDLRTLMNPQARMGRPGGVGFGDPEMESDRFSALLDRNGIEDPRLTPLGPNSTEADKAWHQKIAQQIEIARMREQGAVRRVQGGEVSAWPDGGPQMRRDIDGFPVESATESALKREGSVEDMRTAGLGVEEVERILNTGRRHKSYPKDYPRQNIGMNQAGIAWKLAQKDGKDISFENFRKLVSALQAGVIEDIEKSNPVSNYLHRAATMMHNW